MTGDDLITALVNAATDDDALAIARTAPAGAVLQAADLLYLDDGHALAWYRKAVAREARI